MLILLDTAGRILVNPAKPHKKKHKEVLLSLWNNTVGDSLRGCIYKSYCVKCGKQHAKVLIVGKKQESLNSVSTTTNWRTFQLH